MFLNIFVRLVTSTAAVWAR